VSALTTASSTCGDIPVQFYDIGLGRKGVCARPKVDGRGMQDGGEFTGAGEAGAQGAIGGLDLTRKSVLVALAPKPHNVGARAQLRPSDGIKTACATVCSINEPSISLIPRAYGAPLAAKARPHHP